MLPNLATSTNSPYNLTNPSMGIKLRPFGKVSRLVFTGNVLVRLDDGGLRSKPAPLAGLHFLNETGGSLSDHRAPLWGLA